MEIQLLENSLSTNKLEKELLLQTSEISQLRARNRSDHLDRCSQFLEPEPGTSLVQAALLLLLLLCPRDVPPPVCPSSLANYNNVINANVI